MASPESNKPAPKSPPVQRGKGKSPEGPEGVVVTGKGGRFPTVLRYTSNLWGLLEGPYAYCHVPGRPVTKKVKVVISSPFSEEINGEMTSGSSTASLVLPRKEANVLKGHEGAVLAVRFNSDGNYCLSCGKDRTLRLWNPHRGIHIKTYKSHGREVRDVHVTSDNTKLCSCGGDRQLFYWDVSTGRVIRKFRGHDSEVNSVKFNEYGSVVVSAGYDQSVRAWDCRSQSTEPIQIINTFSDSVLSVCLTKTEIIAGSVDGTIRTFDIRMYRELVDQLGHPVNCISLSNDANCVLASCLDSTLRLLDRSTGELLQEYKGHTCKSFKMDCCLTNSDAHVTGGSEDGYIFFWDLVDACVVSSFKAHASVVTSVSYHPKECCMITSSVEGTVCVWKT